MTIEEPDNMAKNQQVKKKGGARKGAGRKPKPADYKCKQVYFYVPTRLIPQFKEKVKIILEELTK